MIEYTVIWWDSDEGNTTSMMLKSSNFDDAFAEATTAFEFKQYRQIKLSDGSSEESRDNPHFDPNYITQTEAKQQSDVIFHKPTNGSRSIPESSGWADLYRVCGWLFLVSGIIGTIGIAQENQEAGFAFAVIAIALVLTCFLSAFLIDVLTDMRHYQKQSAECLQKLIEKG